MFCSKCGKENPETSKYCSSCGNPLKIIINKPNSAGIRKALKSLAQSKPKTIPAILFIMIVFFVVIFEIFGLTILKDINIDNMSLFLGSILTLIIISVAISAIITVLFTNISLKIAQDKKVTFKDVFKFSNLQSFLEPLILYFITTIIFLIFFYLPTFFVFNLTLQFFIIILSIIIYIHFYPTLDMFIHISVDEKYSTETFKQKLIKAKEMIRNHRIEFYALYISFIGWYFLSSFTFGILLFWVIPYMTISIAYFYRYINKEIYIETNETGINNSVIVGIVLGIVIFFFLFTSLIFYIQDNLYEKIDYYNSSEIETDNGEALIQYNGQKITFIVPQGFKLEDQNYYGKGYYNKNNDYIYYYVSSYKPNEYEEMKNSYLLSADKTYDSVEKIKEYKVTINNNKVNVFLLKITDDGYTYEETNAFYPVSDNFAIEISIGQDGINNNNISNFIKIKDDSIKI